MLIQARANNNDENNKNKNDNSYYNNQGICNQVAILSYKLLNLEIKLTFLKSILTVINCKEISVIMIKRGILILFPIIITQILQMIMHLALSDGAMWLAERGDKKYQIFPMNKGVGAGLKSEFFQLGFSSGLRSNTECKDVDNYIIVIIIYIIIISL